MSTLSIPASVPESPGLSGLCLTMTERAPLPMATMGGAGHIVRYANPAFCRMMARSKEELVGKPFGEKLPEQEECLLLLDRVYRTGKSESHVEAEDANAEPPAMLWSYAMWPVMQDDHPVGIMIQVSETAKFHHQAAALVEALVIGSVRQDEAIDAVETANVQLQDEMLERMQVEAALRASEDRYRNLFNSMDEGFCVIEMVHDESGSPIDYRYLEVNPSFEKQTGLCGALGKRMRETAPDHEAYWLETYAEILRTGIPMRFESEIKALSRWFDVYAFPLSQPEVGKVAILFNNITPRKQADEKLRISRQALHESRAEITRHAGRLEAQVTERTLELTATNQQLEAFVYSIAHDLRAPLRSMQGFSEMLLEDSGTTLSQDGRDFARRMNKSAQNMDALVSDLLAFSRVSQQGVTLSPVDLEPVVHSVVVRLSDDIQNREAQVDASGHWPRVMAHEPTLTQAIFNLASNALKFVRPGVRPLVRVRAEDGGDFVRVWVEDNGIGIAPAYHQQIFGVFARLNGDDYQGTGIGLAIVQKGIERMGGRVGVESSIGEGSRFWLELRKA